MKKELSNWDVTSISSIIPSTEQFPWQCNSCGICCRVLYRISFVQTLILLNVVGNCWLTGRLLWRQKQVKQVFLKWAHIRSQMAERWGSRASNQKVAGSIPLRAKWCCVLGQDTSPYLPRGACKSLWIRASAKWLNVNIREVVWGGVEGPQTAVSSQSASCFSTQRGEREGVLTSWAGRHLHLQECEASISKPMTEQKIFKGRSETLSSFIGKRVGSGVLRCLSSLCLSFFLFHSFFLSFCLFLQRALLFLFVLFLWERVIHPLVPLLSSSSMEISTRVLRQDTTPPSPWRHGAAKQHGMLESGIVAATRWIWAVQEHAHTLTCIKTRRGSIILLSFLFWPCLSSLVCFPFPSFLSWFHQQHPERVLTILLFGGLTIGGSCGEDGLSTDVSWQIQLTTTLQLQYLNIHWTNSSLM